MEPMYLTMALVLIAVGFLLLAAELVIPTSGTLFVLAVAALIVGIATAFYYDPQTGMVTLVGVGIAFPLAVAVVMHYWPKTPMGKRMILTNSDEDDTLANMPVLLELESLRGRFGRAVSTLRPSGITDFDGRRVDTITEGMMVEPGQWVRCVDVKAGKVIVRPVEKPNLGDLETAVFR
jgi:membrane-bound serine protease (ClpP class)